MNNKLPLTNCWANNKLLQKDNTITLTIKEIQNIPSLDFNPSNPKVKFLPLSPLIKDKNLDHLLKNLTFLKEEKRNKNFQKWLQHYSNNYSIKYILNQITKDIISLVKTKGFTITKQNELKNEIATFIYNISECRIVKNTQK